MLIMLVCLACFSQVHVVDLCFIQMYICTMYQYIDALYTEPLQSEETVFYTSNNTASLFMPSEVEMIMYSHAVN